MEVWWCFCGGGGVFCGGVFVVFVWWCFYGGVAVFLWWWCFCGVVFVAVFFVVVFL